MNEYEQAWSLLSHDQRLDICFRQVMWTIFQATLSGLMVDSRSIVALAETRRFMSGAGSKSRLSETIKEANDAFEENGGWTVVLNKIKPDQLTANRLAYICWWMAIDTRRRGFEDMTFNGACTYMTVFPKNIQDHSPLAKWLRKNSLSVSGLYL